MPIKLNATEKKARTLLIDVAKGAIETRFPRLIGYKEFWKHIFPDETWGQALGKRLTPIVSKISAFELEHGRAPLNELVVRMDTREPGYDWDDLRNGFHNDFNVPLAVFESHAAAQRACWDVWGRQATSLPPPRGGKPKHALTEAEEGEPEDRTVRFRKRNAQIILECKERDHYGCKSCGFRLRVDGVYIIDCHHKYPLGNYENAKITNLDDLMCLCPTCHRIAHARKPFPLGIEEIRKARRLPTT